MPPIPGDADAAASGSFAGSGGDTQLCDVLEEAGWSYEWRHAQTSLADDCAGRQVDDYVFGGRPVRGEPRTKPSNEASRATGRNAIIGSDIYREVSVQARAMADDSLERTIKNGLKNRRAARDLHRDTGWCLSMIMAAVDEMAGRYEPPL